MVNIDSGRKEAELLREPLRDNEACNALWHEQCVYSIIASHFELESGSKLSAKKP